MRYNPGGRPSQQESPMADPAFVSGRVKVGRTYRTGHYESATFQVELEFAVPAGGDVDELVVHTFERCARHIRAERIRRFPKRKIGPVDVDERYRGDPIETVVVGAGR